VDNFVVLCFVKYKTGPVYKIFVSIQSIELKSNFYYCDILVLTQILIQYPIMITKRRALIRNIRLRDFIYKRTLIQIQFVFCRLGVEFDAAKYLRGHSNNT